MGRPSSYTPEIGEQVCELIESVPGSIRVALEAREDLPGFATVYRWEQQFPEFRERLSRARELRAHLMADDAVAIADESWNDTILKTGRDGEAHESPNSEWMARSRLRVETRRWHAKVMNQRAYGDHASLNVGGQPGNPLEVKHAVDLSKLSEEERDRAAELARLAMQGKS